MNNFLNHHYIIKNGIVTLQVNKIQLYINVFIETSMQILNIFKCEECVSLLKYVHIIRLISYNASVGFFLICGCISGKSVVPSLVITRTLKTGKLTINRSAN